MITCANCLKTADSKYNSIDTRDPFYSFAEKLGYPSNWIQNQFNKDEWFCSELCELEYNGELVE